MNFFFLYISTFNGMTHFHKTVNSHIDPYIFFPIKYKYVNIGQRSSKSNKKLFCQYLIITLISVKRKFR